MPTTVQKKLKILLLRFSSIGDIVLTTPVIRCLKKQTGAEIHFLTKKAFQKILEPNPHLDRVWTFEKTVREVLPDLKKENFDFVADLHHNLRSLEVKLSLGKPARSFPKLNFEKWLLVRTGLDWLPDVHIVHRYLQTVENLRVAYDGEGLDYFIPPDEEVNLAQLSPLLFPEKFTAFVIGATHATKRLPSQQIVKFCQKIEGQIVLLGGAAEAADGEQIASNFGGRVLNLCGKLSLGGSASVVRQAARVFSHDTGLMHIAAAFRRPIFSIWGSTVPRFGMFPFFPDGLENLNKTLEVKDLSCRPCSKIGFDVCPKGHFRCMNLLVLDTDLTDF